MKKALSLILALMLTATMATSAVAANFTPSVTGKDAPDVVTTTVISKDGKKTSYIGQIVDKDGKAVKKVEKSKITITPVSQSKKASKETQKVLDQAYKHVKEAKTLKDLAPDIEKHLKSLSKNLKVSDMVVRDLFNISIDKNTEKLLTEGAGVQLTFKLGVKAKDKIVCMRSIGDGKWEVIDASKIKNNKDGTVTVEVAGSGPIIFAVQKQKVVRKTLNSAS